MKILLGFALGVILTAGLIALADSKKSTGTVRAEEVVGMPVPITVPGTMYLDVPAYLKVTCVSIAPRGFRRGDPVLNARLVTGDPREQELQCWPKGAIEYEDGGTP